MKRLYQYLKGLFFLILCLILIYCILNYRSDIPKEEIVQKYSLPNSQFVEIDGMKVHYTIDGEGFPILLIHGTSSSLHTWNEWTKTLSQKYKVIRVDLPGFGLTGKHSNNKYSTKAYTEFLSKLLKKLNLSKVHIAGNSFGGYLAWNFALKHPKQVNNLILLNSSGYPLPKDAPIPLGLKMAQLPIISTLMKKITPESIINATIEKAYENDELISEETRQRYIDLLLMEGNRSGLVGKSQQIRYEHYKKIPEMDKNTLILWGEKDEVVSVDLAYMFEKDIPNNKLIIYPEIGHLPMEEIPIQSVRDVILFLEENQSP